MMNKAAVLIIVENLPVPFESIFRWKIVESTVLASWAFLFLIAPLLVAYGLTRGVPWHFYFVTLGLMGVFICLPAVLGCALAILAGRFLDRRGFQVGLVAAALLLICLAASSSVTYLPSGSIAFPPFP